ncbi:type III-A CRISPR-associated protein Csm2 [Methanopyrus kandleri]
MGADLRPAELAEEYLYKPGRLDRNRREDAERRFEELLNDFKARRIQLKPSDDGLLELAFFTALVSLNVSNSQLRRLYAEITNVRNEARRAKEGKRSWEEDVVAALGKARVVLAYTKGRQGKEFERLYEVLDEALRRATKIVEESEDDDVRRRAIEALHFLAEGIVAFHRFLGGRN